MICQIALLFSLFFFHNTIAIPVPDIAAHDCPEAIYKVTEAINVAGKTFLSGDSCKNNYKADPNGNCKIGATDWYQWAVVPLVPKNVAGTAYNLTQIADAANAYGKIGAVSSSAFTPDGAISASAVTLNGASEPKYCKGAHECGLLVTPQYVHITGLRTFPKSCRATAPTEFFEIWLPKQVATSIGPAVEVQTQPCTKTVEKNPPDMPACPPNTEPWTEQIVSSDTATTSPVNFAKLEGINPHGSGRRYRVRFNSGNPKFGDSGRGLLGALNEKVFHGGAATADAGNWQEWKDDLSDIAEFNFDAPDGKSLADTCRSVALALESVSGMGDSARGTCS